MSYEAARDRLRAGELVPSDGGQWRGLLFENPALGLPPELSWSFTFAFAEVSRDFGASRVSVDIEWVPLTVASWRHMAGQAARCDQFAEPVEASVYFFEHHRFERIDLRILDQRETAIHVAADLSGDIDGLGTESITADAWLAFAGIDVRLSAVVTPEAAAARLEEFTDIAGLSRVAHHAMPSITLGPEG